MIITSAFKLNNIFITVFLCLNWLLTPSVFANEAMPLAQQLVNQMSQANRELNYEGIFTYRRHGRMDTMRIIHKAGPEGVRERLVSLTGFAREVIRDKRAVTCILPDDQSVLVEKSSANQFSVKLPEPIETISAYYDFAIAGQQRVAGRSAWVVKIVSKDEYRYGYQLWIDLDTKLLLKSELKNLAGKLLEEFSFAKIRIMDSIPEEWLRSSVAIGVDYTWHDNVDKAANASPKQGNSFAWKAAWLPDGFIISDQDKQAIGANNMLVDHIMYSDGLATVSVFIEKLEKNLGVVKGSSSMGGVSVFSTIVDSHLITAMGEVPQNTVKLIARSIIHSK